MSDIEFNITGIEEIDSVTDIDEISSITEMAEEVHSISALGDEAITITSQDEDEYSTISVDNYINVVELTESNIKRLKEIFATKEDLHIVGDPNTVELRSDNW